MAIDLDIELLRTFVSLTETESFTATGEALGATQSTVSMRLKRLEDRLGHRLFDRTPRAVVATTFGEGFVADARRLLALHDEIVRRATARTAMRPITLGVSEHATGGRLPEVLRHLRAAAPDVRPAVTLGNSEELLGDFEAGRFDAVVIRRTRRPDGGAIGGRLLFDDDMVWCASPDLAWEAGEVVPLAVIARPCRVHETATSVLETAGSAYFAAFVSRDLVAVQAAVAAGLGIGCMGRSAVPEGCRILGSDDGLPALPTSEVVLFARRDRTLAEVFDHVADAFRGVPAEAALRRRA